MLNFLSTFSFLFGSQSSSLYVLLLRFRPILFHFYWFLSCLVAGDPALFVAKKFSEKGEVGLQKHEPHLLVLGSNHARYAVQVGDRIEYVGGLCLVARHEKVHRCHNHRSHLLMSLGQLEQQVDSVALDFLGCITQFVDDDLKYHVLHLWFLLEATLEIVERILAVELQIIVTHGLQHHCDIL